jgi:hypothetical protein
MGSSSVGKHAPSAHRARRQGKQAFGAPNERVQGPDVKAINQTLIVEKGKCLSRIMFWNCSRKHTADQSMVAVQLALCQGGRGYAVPNVGNEKTKLLANALDRASTTCLALGVIAPIAAAFYTTASVRTPLGSVLTGTAIWLGVAIGLHMGARWILNRLDP